MKRLLKILEKFKICQKILWAFINLKKVNSSCKINNYPGRKSKLIAILIDYDEFKDRKFKNLKRGSKYPCGRDAIENVKLEIKKRNIDYVEMISSDNSNNLHVELNKLNYVKNQGTDVAQIKLCNELIKKYKKVLVVNSSANSEDSKSVGLLIDASEIVEDKQVNYIIGFNGNSMISPRLPLSPAITPHVTTNFFICDVGSAISTLKFKPHKLISHFSNGFASKSYAIRYFEILLSTLILKNNGNIYLLKGSAILDFKKNKWPISDTRYK
jgi:hypothetical protein